MKRVSFIKSIKVYVILYSIALALFIGVGYTSVALTTMTKMSTLAYEESSQSRMEGYDDAVRFQVQNAITVLNQFYNYEQEGWYSREEAQEAAKEVIKGMRYGDDKSGYFWIDDTDYTLIAHPILPDQEGNNRYDLKDKNDVYIIREIMKVTENPEGGYSEFYFTKSDGVTVAPKRTYSIKFEPWNWVISSGNYYDDINSKLDGLNAIIRQKGLVTYRELMFTVVFDIVFALAAAFIFATLFAKPIVRVNNDMNKMSEGDLTVRTKVSKRKNEITQMQHSINDFTESMHSVIESVRDNSQMLKDVAENLDTNSTAIAEEIDQIVENISSLSTNAENQKNISNQTSNSMNEIGVTINELTNQLEEQNASVVASSAAIEEMIANINSITDNINRFGLSFKELTESTENGQATLKTVIDLIKAVSDESKNLQSMNQVIANVASQTNLLAMNAAIEAAHAGEAGKGFSVVAEEIRKLSENTSVQSHKITESLNGIIKNIEDVSKASQTAGKAFDGISDQVQVDGTLIEQIRNAMEEQNAGSQQIVTSLSNIQQATHTIISSARNIDKETKDVLNEMDLAQNATEELSQMSEEITVSTKTIEQNIKQLSDMSVKNKEMADKLSEKASGWIL